jgi:acyl carrier protein
MTKDEFVEELTAILNEDGALSAETVLDDLEGWDSTGVLGVIALLDEIGANVGVDDLRACKTIGDLILLTGDKVKG